MLGQSMLLKTGERGKELFLPQLEKEKLPLTCLPAPGGGWFCWFLGGFCVCFCLFLNHQEERQTLDKNLEAILQGSSFLCAKNCGVLLWHTGIRLQVSGDLLELLRESLHPNDRN